MEAIQYIISKKTQLEMYKYIQQKSKINGVPMFDDDQTLITQEILNTAKKLYRRTELYICRLSLKKDDNRLVRLFDYRAKSNLLIYYVLHYRMNTNAYVYRGMFKIHSKDDNGASKDDTRDCNDLEMFTGISENEIESIIEDREHIEESGSADRKRLVRLCKYYLDKCDLTNARDANMSLQEAELLRECWLAEKALSIYTKDKLKDTEYKVEIQKSFKSKGEWGQNLKPDILISNKSKIFVIDVKVYKDLTVNFWGTEKYCSNENRFQVNSYMGRVLQENRSENTECFGVLLHVINSELNDKHGQMQGADLTVENDREIRLWLLLDKGLDRIFEEYSEMLNKQLGIGI